MADDERRYQQLVDCYRSGQISAAQWEMHLKETPGLLAFTRKNTRGAPAPATVEAGLASSAAVTMQDKLVCARRELAARRRAYPGHVASGRMTQEIADRELLAMEAIVVDYERVDEFDLKRRAQTALDAIRIHERLTRNDALEEAAKIADEMLPRDGHHLEMAMRIAVTIRALKVMP